MTLRFVGGLNDYMEFYTTPLYIFGVIHIQDGSRGKYFGNSIQDSIELCRGYKSGET